MLSPLCYFLGYATGLAAFLWMARRRRLATEGVLATLVVGLIGGLIFANLTQWLVVGVPGKTVLGGVAGAYACVALYKRRIGLKRPLGDLFAVAVCAGEAVGRWGCFFGGCCYGKPSQVAWAVWQHGAYRHPTQLYLSGACLLILVVLLHLEPVLPENGLFFLQGALYCLARFIVEIFRDVPAAAAGLTAAQWACIAGALFFGGRLWWLLRRVSPPIRVGVLTGADGCAPAFLATH